MIKNIYNIYISPHKWDFSMTYTIHIHSPKILAAIISCSWGQEWIEETPKVGDQGLQGLGKKTNSWDRLNLSLVPNLIFFQVSGVLQDGGGHRVTHDSTHPKLVGSERSEFGDWPITWAKKGDRSVFFGSVKPHVKTIKKIQRRVAPSQFPLAQWHRIWGVFWATEMGGALWISWLHWEWPVLWRPEGRCHFRAVKKDRSLIWQRKTPCKNH